MIRAHINILESRYGQIKFSRKIKGLDEKYAIKQKEFGNCNLGTQIKIVSQSRENKQIGEKNITFQAESALQEILGQYLECKKSHKENVKWVNGIKKDIKVNR